MLPDARPGVACSCQHEGMTVSSASLIGRDADVARLDDALERARSGSPATTTSAPEADLTARESQVLALIAEWLSNRQIGERLFISPKTASVHVSAILRKLGASTRTQAVYRARQTASR